MDFNILNKIEKSLKTIECKSYSLDINFDDNNRVFIEKKPEEEIHKIGFTTDDKIQKGNNKLK